MTDLTAGPVKPATAHAPSAHAGPSPSLFVRRRRRESDDAAAIRRPSISYWQDAKMRLAKNRIALAAGAYILFLGVTSVVLPLFLPYSHDEQEIWNKHALPSLGSEAIVIPADEAEFVPVSVDPATIAATSDATVVDVPATPQNLRVLGEPLTTGIVVQWDGVADVDGYRLYRSIAADTLGVPIEDVAADQLSFRDTASIAPQMQYHYFVMAFNAFGDSAPSPELTVTAKLALPLDVAQQIDPQVQVGALVLTKPHYLGTDYLGRDLLARVLAGARVSLTIGFVAPLLYILFGIIFGSIAGFFGGMVDNIMMRVADVISTVPELLVVILLQVVMGNGLTTLIISMVAVSWARSAQQVRGEVLRLREMEFVHAAKVLGTSFPTTVFRHLLPNVMGTVLIMLTLAVPQAIFTEAFLSFIGLGIAPPMTSWGIVTKEGARTFLTYPHELIIPSVLISTTMLAFNLFGDGLRDALDPKLRGAK